MENKFDRTRETLWQILADMGCNPRDGEDTDIVADFQGETFVFAISSTGQFIRVWDMGWLFLDPDDKDLEVYDRAMNLTNLEPGASVLKGRTDDNRLTFLARWDVVSPTEIVTHDQQNYIGGILTNFLCIKDTFRQNIEKTFPSYE